MGVLKKLTDEYFENIIREEEKIDISDLGVEIVSFTDGKGQFHNQGYKVRDDNERKMANTLSLLIKKIIKKRGDNCDLNDIDVSNIKRMNYYYMGSVVGVFQFSDFNGDISGWDVSNVTDMESMFRGAKNFNKPLKDWGKKLNKVKNMSRMFCGATDFNQSIGNWDVSGVEDMCGMFFETENFNKSLEDWGDKLGNVKDMGSMFAYSGFNKPLKNWGDKLGNVRTMKMMFSNSNFNQPIGNWDVSDVVDMEYMFSENTNFNQNIDGWELKDDCKTGGMFHGCPLEKNPPKWYKKK